MSSRTDSLSESFWSTALYQLWVHRDSKTRLPRIIFILGLRSFLRVDSIELQLLFLLAYFAIGGRVKAVMHIRGDESLVPAEKDSGPRRRGWLQSLAHVHTGTCNAVMGMLQRSTGLG